MLLKVLLDLSEEGLSGICNMDPVDRLKYDIVGDGESRVIG
jgi:hypothetical protein